MRLKLLVLCVLISLIPTAGALAASAEESFKLGQQAYQQERFAEAADHFGAAADALAAAKQYDQARSIYGNAAVVRMKQENWQAAYDLLSKALGLPGGVASDFRLRAARNMTFCADKLGRNDLKAEAAAGLLESGIELPPTEKLNFLSMQGDAYRAAERYSLACQSYEKALALQDIPPETRVNLLVALGLAQGSLGRYAQALEALGRAAGEAESRKFNLALVEATSNMGIIYWEIGRYAKAAELLQKALEHSRSFQMLRHEGVDSNNMGLVYKSAGRLNDALAQVGRAVDIAERVENRRDAAIALGNRALIYRMQGDVDAARGDYAKALAACREVRFSEGEASTLMGLARIDCDVDKNYSAALEKLNQALAIYEKLDNPGFLAEACVQIGRLYQKIATPERRSRDLVFEDDEPATVSVPAQEALAKSREFFARARELAEKSGRREMQWSAEHGLAFAEREAGNLAQAERHHSKAVSILLSMKADGGNPEFLQDMLRDKDDLFAEAIDVCARLYQESRDQNLLKKQMEYDEILRNEVMRANMHLAAIEYADPAKKALFDEVAALGAGLKKAEAAARASADSSTPAARAENVLAAQEASKAAEEFESKLALWKKQYPADAVVFDSAASLNLRAMQADLGPEQAVVQYMPLEDSLIIMTITREGVNMINVAVGYRELAGLIRDNLLAANIESFGRAEIEARLGYEQGIDILEKLSSYLYMPVREQLAGKNRLYLVTSKYLAYVPFAALVVGKKADGAPIFLVEEKTVSFARLSMLPDLSGSAPIRDKRAIVVGNPQHSELEGGLPPIQGAENEAVLAGKLLQEHGYDVTLLLRGEASEDAWKNRAGEGGFSVMYFATHGVPFAEMMYTAELIQKRLRNHKSVGAKQQKFFDFYSRRFQNKSHLNGFLYMAYPGGAEDGVLTLKEILEMPDSTFGSARLAVLSACNTAVSYSPKVIRDEHIRDALEEQAAREMASAGWTPGVDQATLTDTFIRRNFTSVYGTLWFADDKASADIMGAFVANLRDLPPAEALRAAQLKYLQSPSYGPEEYPLHPFFWACGSIFGQ